MNRTLQICLGGLACTALLLGIGTATSKSAPVSALLPSAYASLTGDYREDAKAHGTIDLTGEQFSSIKLDADSAEITFEQGDKYAVEWWGDKEFLSCEVKNDVLTLSTEALKNYSYHYGQSFLRREIVITVPKNTLELENISLDANAGYIESSLDGLTCRRFSAETNAGYISLNNLTCDTLSADVDAGSITFGNLDAGSCELNADVGTIDIRNGIIRKDSSISCDIGSICLMQDPKSQLGTMKIAGGSMSTISINDEDVYSGSETISIGSGKAVLSVSCDAGSIEIYTSDFYEENTGDYEHA